MLDLESLGVNGRQRIMLATCPLYCRKLQQVIFRAKGINRLLRANVLARQSPEVNAGLQTSLANS